MGDPVVLLGLEPRADPKVERGDRPVHVRLRDEDDLEAVGQDDIAGATRRGRRHSPSSPIGSSGSPEPSSAGLVSLRRFWSYFTSLPIVDFSRRMYPTSASF